MQSEVAWWAFGMVPAMVDLWLLAMQLEAVLWAY
jgi:hypothetical protein